MEEQKSLLAQLHAAVISFTCSTDYLLQILFFLTKIVDFSDKKRELICQLFFISQVAFLRFFRRVGFPTIFRFSLLTSFDIYMYLHMYCSARGGGRNHERRLPRCIRHRFGDDWKQIQVEGGHQSLSAGLRFRFCF